MAESVTFESALKQWAGELRSNDQIAVEFNRLLQLQKNYQELIKKVVSEGCPFLLKQI